MKRIVERGSKWGGSYKLYTGKTGGGGGKGGVRACVGKEEPPVKA